MKLFGVTIGGKESLTGEQKGLQKALLPVIKNNIACGYSRIELGQALTDYWRRRPNDTITTEASVQVLENPESLILNYRKENNKRNRPSTGQLAVLMSLVKTQESRDKVENLLASIMVIDAIPSVKFKQLVSNIVSHDFQVSSKQLLQWRFEA